LTRPPEVSEEAWATATRIASRDRAVLAELVRTGRVRRQPGVVALPLPQPPRNPTIRPKKKRGKR
jgi:hypothetical protein